MPKSRPLTYEALSSSVKLPLYKVTLVLPLASNFVMTVTSMICFQVRNQMVRTHERIPTTTMMFDCVFVICW